MIINCHRCEKEINSPDAGNADYIQEEREVLVTIQEEVDGELVDKQVLVLEPCTWIICPDCHQEGDVLIWGIHKAPGPYVPGQPARDLAAELDEIKQHLGMADKPNLWQRFLSLFRG